MTYGQNVRMSVVLLVAKALRVPVRVREHFLMGFGYTDTMPRTGSAGQS
jgi:hypothetical protein